MQMLSRYVGALMFGAALVAACTTETTTSALSTSADTTTEAITFNKQVAPLLQQQCQVCHRDGGQAPMALQTYAQAKRWKNAIKSDVVSGNMPHARPVRINTGCSTADTFLGPRRLTTEEIDTFSKWVDQGAVEGDPADLPPPVTFHDPAPGEWLTGTPDLDLVNTPGGFNIPAHVPRDIFRRIPFQTNYDADKYITSIEGHPDNGAWSGTTGSFPIVHHMELWIDASGKSLQQEAVYQAANPDIPGPGFEGEWDFPETPLLLGMWIPGTSPPPLPPGFGYKLPKGAVLVVEMHYAGDRDNAMPINDQSHWGIHFASAPVKPFSSLVVRNETFDVPANVDGTTAEYSYTFDHDVFLRAITPHMHQLGRDYLLTVEQPNVAPRCLADVQWDFEHQDSHFLRKPQKLLAGTALHWKCIYDNTATSPRQFNVPPADVKSGRTSRDEMCQLTMHWSDEEFGAPVPAPTTAH